MENNTNYTLDEIFKIYHNAYMDFKDDEKLRNIVMIFLSISLGSNILKLIIDNKEEFLKLSQMK